MQTKLLVIAAFTLSISMIFFTQFGNDSAPAVPFSPITNTLKAVEVPIPQKSETQRSNINCETKAPLFNPQLRFRATDPKVADKLLTQAFVDSESVVSMAATNADANIALFVVASSCPAKSESTPPSKSKNWCLGSDKVRSLHFHPIKLLQRAAELGSEEAKLMYAVNAPQAAAYLRKIDDDQARTSAKEVLLNGERLGIEAARHGNPDAYRYMSRAYEIGSFGPPDLEAAYAFALPLKAIGDSTVGQRLMDLERRLPARFQDSARRTAFGCQPKSDVVIQKNPFS